MLASIEFQQLHLAIAQMLSAQGDDPFVLARGVFSSSPPPWSPRFFFQPLQKILLKSTLPLVEGFACNPEVSARQRHIFAVLLPEDDPFQPTPCRTGQMQEFSGLAPSGVLISKL